MPEKTGNSEVKVLDTSEYGWSDDFQYLLKNKVMDELKEMISPLMDSLRKYRYADAASPTGEEPAIIRTIRTSATPRKAELISFILLFLNPCNFHCYLECMPENARNLLSTIAEKHIITETEAVQIYGDNVVEQSFFSRSHGVGILRFWVSSDFVKTVVDDNRSYKLCVYFSYNFIYQLFHRIGRADSRPVSDLPEGLVTFSAEKSIFSELPLLDSLYANGVLSVGQNKLRSAAYNKAASNLHFSEFPLNHEGKKNKADACTRTFYYPLIYALYRQHTDVAGHLADAGLVRGMEEFLHDGNEDNFFKYLMPHISGVKRNVLDWAAIYGFLATFKQSLSYLDDKKWGSVDYICHLMRSLNVDISCSVEKAFCTMGSYDFGRMTLENAFTSKYLGYNDIVSQIAKPAVRSMLYAWASLGLLEIACTPSLPEDAVSPFDSLQYVRLTELGKYALGKVKTYSPPIVQDAQIPFELSDDHLLIKVLNPESHLIVVLDRYAKQVAPTLYKAEEAHFISDCENTADLERKIQQFKNLFDKELPHIWTSFFENLLKQSKAFTTAGKQYVLRRIDREDRRLQDIILSDSTLRKYILRAEDYLILIEQKHVDDVSRIFRSYGYIL